VAEAVGGVADHVHLLLRLKPTATISDFVRELKKASSLWSAELHEPRFQWQEGYSIFSVSSSLRETVRRYIGRQEEHHQRIDFRAELMALLSKHGVEFHPEHLE
jgi:putative transposase